MTLQEIRKKLVKMEEAKVVSLCADLLMLLSYDCEEDASDNDFKKCWKQSRRSILETASLTHYGLQDLLER